MLISTDLVKARYTVDVFSGDDGVDLHCLKVSVVGHFLRYLFVGFVSTIVQSYWVLTTLLSALM